MRAPAGFGLSRNLVRADTKVSPIGLTGATMRRYEMFLLEASIEGGIDMQLHCSQANGGGLRAFAAPARCPHCGDLMIAPVVSEFVEGGEIRHHWECDACGEPSCTSIPLDLE
jgi:hypothetical protein